MKTYNYYYKNNYNNNYAGYVLYKAMMLCYNSCKTLSDIKYDHSKNK